MRQDMHRLASIRSLDITGSRKLITRGIVDLESLPTRQSMRSAIPHYSYVRVTRLNPASRWLQQQVGRPWDGVYAELRERFDARNTQQATVLERLLDKVERNAYLDEQGKPRVSGPYGSYAVGGLYVHPHTGLLANDSGSEGAAKRRAEARRQAKAELARRRIDVDERRQLHYLDGQWYWVELAPIAAPATIVTKPLVSALTGQVLVESRSYLDHDSACRDVVSGEVFWKVPTHAWEVASQVRAYGRPGVYARRKQQASARDVTQFVLPVQLEC